MVPTLYLDRLPDLTSVARKPEVEFVVLILNKLLVKKTDSIENFTAPAAKIDGIDDAGMIGIVPAGASVRKRRLKSGRDCFTDSSLAFGDPGTTDIISSRFTQELHALINIIRSIVCMDVH